MQTIFARLGDLGPAIAVLLAAGGLAFGLFGWRMVRYLVAIDAFLVALVVGALLEDRNNSAENVLLVKEATLVLAIALPWLAWRYHRGAFAVLGGAVWFFLPHCLLAGSEVPVLVRLLLGVVGCGLALAMHLTLRREAAVVTTGLHGGWLCLAAFVAVSADPRSYGGQLFAAMSSHALWFPLVGTALSAILIALQWADMERDMDRVGC